MLIKLKRFLLSRPSHRLYVRPSLFLDHPHDERRRLISIYQRETVINYYCFLSTGHWRSRFTRTMELPTLRRPSSKWEFLIQWLICSCIVIRYIQGNVVFGAFWRIFKSPSITALFFTARLQSKTRAFVFSNVNLKRLMTSLYLNLLPKHPPFSVPRGEEEATGANAA